MELQAITGQLYIVDGVVQETTADSATAVPGLLAQPAPSRVARGRDRDFLFAHLTLSGQPAETADLSRQLLALISRRFYQTSGSVTAALRQGLLNANQALLQHNLSSGQATREGAITCAVLRHGELYTLQAGESLAMIGRAFGIERLPPKAPDRVTPLGRTTGLDIRYTHHRLQIGDTLLLADPRIAHLPTQLFEDALIDTPVEISLETLIARMDADTARLLLVEFAGELPAGLPDTVQTPALPVVASDATTAAPQPRRTAPQMPVVPADARRPQPVRAHTPIVKRLPDLSADVETSARRATSQAAMRLSRFTGWLAAVLERLQGPTDPEAEAEETNWAIPALLAVIIPILVTAIVSGVYLQWGQVEQLAALKEEMRLNLGLAQQTENEAEARAYYDSVLQMADSAETTLRPDDTDVNQLRQQARAALDSLDRVTRLQGEMLYTYSEGTNLTAVVLQDDTSGNLYTLDGANGAIYLHQLGSGAATEPPQRLLFSGQAVGAHVVGRIVDIMWRNQGSQVSRSGLAMLDSNGALLTYYPDLGDTAVAPLGLASEWQTATAITTYNERLYVLDTGAAQVWKYFPSGNQFDVNADDRVINLQTETLLNEAVDFGIYGGDGSLFVAYSSGRLGYYDTRADRRQWDEAALLTDGNLQAPLGEVTAVKIVGRGLNTSLFVADAANGRILQLNRGGRVLAQYKATGPDGEELLANVSDFAVAENPLRIYVVAGNTLYATAQTGDR